MGPYTAEPKGKGRAFSTLEAQDAPTALGNDRRMAVRCGILLKREGSR